MLKLFLTYLVLFMPGSALLFGFRRRLSFSLLEFIVFGSIIWNYIYLTVSVIIGLFSNLLKLIFLLFSFVSVLFTAIMVVVIIVTSKLNTSHSKITRIRCDKLFWLSLIFIFSLNFLLLYYHSLIYEWDAVYYYIPSAKSIELTGTCSINAYRELNFLDTSPMIPLLYAYILHYFGLDSVYAIPAIFYFLTTLSMYILAREIFDKDLALLAPLIFLSIPLIQIVFGARALYQDIPFYFYLIATTILLIKLTRSLNSYSREALFVIIGMSSSLMFMTRIELGLFIIFSVIAVLIIILRIKSWKFLASLMLGAPYFLREARNIMISSSYAVSLIRLLPIIAAALFLFILLKIKTATANKKSTFPSFQLALVFLMSFIPSILFFFVNNVVRGGFIIPGVPISNDMGKAASIFNQINPVVTAFSYTDLFNWQNIFIVWWTITPFVIPFTIGAYFAFYHLVKDKELPPKDLVLLSIFLGVFVLWVQLNCNPQARRLFYFSLFYTLLILYGFRKLRKLYSKEAFSLRVLLYIAFSLFIVWNKYSLKSINDVILIYPKTYSAAYDLELVFYTALAFLIIFLPYESYAKKVRKNKFVASKISYVFSIIFLLLLYTNLSLPIITEALNNGTSLRYRYLFSTYYYPEVVDYYNKKINDTYLTLGFFCHELITFANRSVIDLSNPTYGWKIYSVIDNSNKTDILNLFQELNIKYLLLPNDNNRFYNLYRSVFGNTSLKTLLSDPLKLEPITKFKYVTLYRYHEKYLVYSTNYSKIIPWNYNPTVEYTLTKELNTTKFSALTTRSGRISLMYTFDSPLKLHDGLLVRMNTYKKVTAQVFLFTNLANRTSDYLFFSTNLEKGEGNFLITLTNSQVKGDFNPNHIEGVLIGIKTEPNHMETFEVLSIYVVEWDDN